MRPLESFREEARAWLETNFPRALADDPSRQFVDMHGPPNTDPDYAVWKRRMGDKGWGAPTWPLAYGGGGLSRGEAAVLGEELQRIGAQNPIVGMGVSLLGPTLLEFGSEVQKLRHLPGAARGATRWCQGYSEPGAGSDLAALQCRALDKGDHFLVSGQKVWTSGAHYADWCFCLVRTDTAKKHEGISFLLIDMRSPGVEARPIPLIYGWSTFCEVFLTEVVVPKDNLVGTLNGGWDVGKRLLQFERSGIGGMKSDPGPGLVELAKTYVGLGADGRLADSDLRARLSQHEIEARVLALTLERVREEARASALPPATDSILKNAAAAVSVRKHELKVELMGAQGLGWAGTAYAPREVEAVRDWLADKAKTIYGGTTEVQYNVVAKRRLGLPS